MTAVFERIDAAPVRLLLVDDHVAGLAARTSVLSELGFAITTAPSAEEAIKKFEQSPFPIVVTDYRLPGKSGVDLIADIRALAPDTKVVLLSGFVEALGLTEAMTRADVVISKSANEVTQMIRAVQRLMRRAVSKKPGSVIKRSSSRAGGAG